MAAKISMEYGDARQHRVTRGGNGSGGGSTVIKTHDHMSHASTSAPGGRAPCHYSAMASMHLSQG